MDLWEKGWFTEVSELWPNQRASFKVEKILAHEKSKYQDILIFKTVSHGRMLALDGIIQCCEFDEFSYQEMVSFLPLNCHFSPKRVLIVGGGDGGVAREVSKHPLVQTIEQCEIDGRVVELCKEHMPFMGVGFSSPKLALHIEDGIKYIENHKNEFDVIITDSSDPVGPAVCLYTDDYFAKLKAALKPKGIICSQGGNAFNYSQEIRELIQVAKRTFSNVAYSTTNVPTYPSGQLGFLLATNDNTVNFEKPLTVFNDKQREEMKLRYYDQNVHNASFQLPLFVKKTLNL
ncbi:spermidine synthase [Chrysoperla carnea]|uniref:spermidine synthase n=1 Tax=Chrysoperla carnea TaxID=189513 RepID=UPI001D063D99|nr:spermidine synthase [Chrysoperla carnea]